MPGTIKNRINEVRGRIGEAASRSGRSPEDITLIAVSKTYPASDVDDAAACGIRDFGENKVQELLIKQPECAGELRWHLIGHLQTNKVRSVVGRVCLIHSVDSLHLAEEIDRRAAAQGITQDVLLQVNAAGEDTKFGVSPDGLIPLAEGIAEKFVNVRIRGLMQIAPYAEDPEEVRKWFRKLRQLKEELARRGFTGSDILSMGMSHDFETAIEEGATHIRVGTAIFGERDYSNHK